MTEETQTTVSVMHQDDPDGEPLAQWPESANGVPAPRDTIIVDEEPWRVVHRLFAPENDEIAVYVEPANESDRE